MPVPKNLQVKRSSAGLGLFALEPIKKQTTIIEYVGKRIPAEVGDGLNSRYIFRVSKTIDIDGRDRSNTARYVNHSCRPNCEAINRKNRVFIVAKRAIKAGEELTYHYGKEYFEGVIKPEGCRCLKCQGK